MTVTARGESGHRLYSYARAMPAENLAQVSSFGPDARQSAPFRESSRACVRDGSENYQPATPQNTEIMPDA